MCTAGHAAHPCHSTETVPKGQDRSSAPAREPGRARGRQHPGQSCPRHGPAELPRLRGACGPGCLRLRGACGSGVPGCSQELQLARTPAFHHIAAEFLLSKRDKHKRQQESLCDHLPSLLKAGELAPKIG